MVMFVLPNWLAAGVRVKDRLVSDPLNAIPLSGTRAMLLEEAVTVTDAPAVPASVSGSFTSKGILLVGVSSFVVWSLIAVITGDSLTSINDMVTGAEAETETGTALGLVLVKVAVNEKLGVVSKSRLVALLTVISPLFALISNTSAGEIAQDPLLLAVVSVTVAVPTTVPTGLFSGTVKL